MDETKPDYKKGMKKNRKMIKNCISNTKTIILMLFAIAILILFIAYPVSAVGYGQWSGSPVWVDYGYAGNITNPYYAYTDVQKNAICTGYAGEAATWYGSYQPVIQVWGNSTNYNTSYVSGSYWPPAIDFHAGAATEYNAAYKTFNMASTGGVSLHWTCKKTASPADTYSYFETVYARKITGWDASGDTFTINAVPQSGNASLSVNFLPLVSNTSNINRIVWDFDGGLGSETKYDNASFAKTYATAGHFIVRADLYTLKGAVVSASKNIDVYNYTLGITPTPTLTPTPAPTPQGDTTKKFNVYGYDVTNYTNVSSLSIGMIDVDDVGSGWFNITASSGEYTFAGYGTGGNKPFVENHHYMLVFSKTGYETLITPAYTFTSSLLTYGVGGGYALRPSAYTPTATGFTLGVRLISTTSGELSNGAIGTITISNQSSSWTSSLSNPAGGMNYFAGLTPSHSYKINVNVNGYEYYTGYFASGSSMSGTTQEYLAYIVPSNQLPSAFTLSISPNSGTVNDTYTIKLTGDISTASLISYKYSTSSVWGLNLAATSGYTQYSKITGSWLGWSGSSYSVATANPAQVTGKLQPTISPETEQVTVTAYITIGGNVYQATDTISLVSLGKEPIIIVAYDMSDTSSGASASAKMDTYDSHILDLTTGVWTNTSYDVSNFYNAYFFYTPNSVISYYGSAAGYYNTITETRVLPDASRGIEYKFYKNQLPPTVENVSLHVNVRNIQTQPLPQARVSINDGQKCYTNEQGSCSFYVLNNVNYTASGTAYGYGAGTAGIKTSNTSANVINLVLVRASTTTSPYTGIQTPRVTPTYTNTSGLTNATSLEEVTCNLDTSDMGVFQLLMNNIACAGVKGAVAQGFVLSALIMFVFAMGLSRYAKGMGALAGVIIGAVVSFGMQLLPFWILIFVVIVCGLIFARLVTSQAGG